jgi:hypothetical protein
MHCGCVVLYKKHILYLSMHITREIVSCYVPIVTNYTTYMKEIDTRISTCIRFKKLVVTRDITKNDTFGT